MQSSLKVGDEVMLTSGIFGILRETGDDAPARGDRRRRDRQGRPRCRWPGRTAAGGHRARSRRRTEMARKTTRPGRTLVVFFLAAGGRLRAGRARRHLEARAGPRPPGRHPHPARAPRAARRARASTRPRGIIDQRVNGSGVTEAEVDHAGQPVRRRDPRQEPARPGRHRQASGAAALPHRGLRRAARAAPPAPAAAPARAGRRACPAPPRHQRQHGRLHRRDHEPARRRLRRLERPSDAASRRRARTGRRSRSRTRRAPSRDPRPARASSSSSASSARRRARRRPARPRRGSPSASPTPSSSDPAQTGLDVDDATRTRPRSPPSTPSPARRSRPVADNPDQAAGHLRHRLATRRHQVPPLARGHRGHRPQERQRRHPAERCQLAGQPDARRRRASRSSTSSRGPWSAPDQQFAIVLDGQVISVARLQRRDPQRRGPDHRQLHRGQRQEPGHEPEVRRAADRLRPGRQPVETIGPSLAGDQLSAGITAGIIGLLLVMLYCLIYYRGLGLVVDRLAARGRRHRPTRWCCCSARPPASRCPCPASPA